MDYLDYLSEKPHKYCKRKKNDEIVEERKIYLFKHLYIHGTILRLKILDCSHNLDINDTSAQINCIC